MSAPELQQDDVDAIRADGGLVRIRTVAAADRAGLDVLHEHASDRSNYLRFFSFSRDTSGEYLDRLVEPSSPTHHAVAACVDGEIVGVAGFEGLTPTSAEIALLVADERQHEGIGTLLLEHLAGVARHVGLLHFVAGVLAENGPMLRVIHDIGFRTSAVLDHGEVRVTLDLSATPALIAAVGDRERSADAASLRPLLRPTSVAVVGASPRPGSVGHLVLKGILAGGFTGDVYAVNPGHNSILGVPCLPSAADLPVAVDLAVVAVPAARVADAVRSCGERGVHAVLLLTAGFGETGVDGRTLQDEVSEICRTYGMRLIGPNCVGILNTDPAVRLDATFAGLPMRPGVLGISSQSGAFGIAFVVAAVRRGLGVGQFVSVGNKADVSGNDLLLAWEDDPQIKIITMYIESIADAPRFVRIARRVASKKPILAIKSGRTAVGQRAGQSHTAAAASSEVAIDAVFAEAGVLRMSTMQELLAAARVLAEQPLPAGPRVAIIGNSGGPGILAADTASAAGLQVIEFDAHLQERLRQAVPSAASTQNPVDLGAAVGPGEAHAAIELLLAAHDVDAVLTVFTELAVSDPEDIMAAVASAAATSDKPLVATQVGGAERTVAAPGSARSVPVFTFPEPAAAALGVACRYAKIRGETSGPIVRPDDLDRTAARVLVSKALARGTDWLAPDEVARLLFHYGIPVSPQRVVVGVNACADAATELGYPVVVKAAGGVLHKSDVGAVRLNVRDEDALRVAVADIMIAVPHAAGLLIQPMAPTGTELIIGAVRDPQVGPMVMVGAGGVLADLVDDRAFRLAPLAVEDAEVMIAGLRLARLLDGYRGRPVVRHAAVADVLVRVAALAADLPELAELDLNPLICNEDGPIVVDARIRVAVPTTSHDPLLRQLRGLVHPERNSTHD
ncbi:MAG: GNAT family N-acetyltransferase [Jatrophihabitantaceae bacterium]